MDGNSSRTTPTPGRRALPADVEAARDVTRQPSLIPLRSGTGGALITATVLASMAGFLDASVVNVAVPAIASDLGASLVALQWTLTGYLLTAAALLLVSGALADRYGRRNGLTAGPTVGWTSARVIAGLVVGAACLIALIPTERRVRAPMLKLSLFASRQFTAINIATVVFYGALAAAGYLLVLRCELTLGYTATAAGAVLIPSSVIFLVLSPVSGALVRQIGPRRLMTAGILAVALGFLWLAHAHPAGTYAEAILPGVLLWGLGLGLTVTPLTAAVLAAVSDADLGEASAISDVASRLGGAIMTALVPVLIGVQAGSSLTEALAHGYRPAMIVLAGLCLVAAVISAIYVQDSRTGIAVFAPPAPYHGCALPDLGAGMVPARAPVTKT